MNIEEIIEALEEIDGETMEHIIRKVGLEDQILRQLIMKTPTSQVIEIIDEKYRIMIMLNVNK